MYLLCTFSSQGQGRQGQWEAGPSSLTPQGTNKTTESEALLQACELPAGTLGPEQHWGRVIVTIFLNSIYMR